MYELLDSRADDVMSKPISVAPDTSLAEVERLADANERLVGIVPHVMEALRRTLAGKRPTPGKGA